MNVANLPNVSTTFGQEPAASSTNAETGLTLWQEEYRAEQLPWSPPGAGQRPWEKKEKVK